jgi:hypothetical protein
MTSDNILHIGGEKPEKRYRLNLGVSRLVTIQHALALLITATQQTMNDPGNSPGVKAARNLEFENYVAARDDIAFQIEQEDALEKRPTKRR